jgi:putative transposase
VLGFARSTIYAGHVRESNNVVPLVAFRRGPKPKMPDADLLEAIRADLAASPFTDKGHRKVWARLRILRDIRVSRTRVLRLMRENALLSPHRRARRKWCPARRHDHDEPHERDVGHRRRAHRDCGGRLGLDVLGG